MTDLKTLWSIITLFNPTEWISSNCSSERRVSSGPFFTKSLAITYFNLSRRSDVTYTGASPRPINSLACETIGLFNSGLVPTLQILSIMLSNIEINCLSSSNLSALGASLSNLSTI